MGRYRCSREGLVYYSNRGGPNGHGYAICLHCGRAEAEANPAGVAAPALVDHKPLRYRRGEDLCPGNHRPFAIKRNITLGHEITTDVVELQPRRPLRRAAANALAIALREALAQELGIEADEMGYGVAKGRNDFGADTVSLLVFDRAAGGGGFSTSFEFLIHPVLRRVERILDCSTPGCETGCAACVLTSDAPDGKDELDRRGALDFVRQYLAFPQHLDEQDRFASGAELSLGPIDEIHHELGRTAQSRLTLFLPRWNAEEAAADWELKDQFLAWVMRGHQICLALPAAHLEELDPAERLALRDFALRHQLSPVQSDAPSFANGSVAIAAVEGASYVVWATPEQEPRMIGPTWGRPVERPVAKASVPLRLSASEVSLDDLLPPPGAQLLEIWTELDVELATFGQRAAKLIVDLLRKSGAWPNSPVARVTYQDGYVSSPLVARLLIDTICHLASKSGSSEAQVLIETRPPRSTDQRGDPWQIWHDWREAEDQRAVVERLGVQRGLCVTLVHRDVPHGRYMRIEYVDGSRATVVLDQGFGAWVPLRHVRVRHDFDADSQIQAQQLATANAEIQRKGSGATYIVAMAGG